VPFTVAGIILKVPVEQQCQKHWEFKRDSISTWFIDEGLKFYVTDFNFLVLEVEVHGLIAVVTKNPCIVHSKNNLGVCNTEVTY